MQNYMGLSNYVWWQGVVEDRQDPLELGRARVRVLGFHSEERSKVPTESLPWAYPAMPLNSTPGSIPNFKEGSWVMGFFRDGDIRLIIILQRDLMIQRLIQVVQRNRQVLILMWER